MIEPAISRVFGVVIFHLVYVLGIIVTYDAMFGRLSNSAPVWFPLFMIFLLLITTGCELVMMVDGRTYHEICKTKKNPTGFVF